MSDHVAENYHRLGGEKPFNFVLVIVAFSKAVVRLDLNCRCHYISTVLRNTFLAL